MRAFEHILNTAILHKGSREAVFSNVPMCRSAAELRQLSDAEVLSTLSLRVFQAGLKHDLVAAKWPAFQTAFNGFDPFYCAMLSDEHIEAAMSNRHLIRHLGKLRSIRHNAHMLRNVATEYGSFAAFIAQWPVRDIVGLWRYLKKHGAQLGGLSGARFLRMLGKDTFLLTDDVLAILKTENVVTKMPSSVKDLNAVQAVFNQWQHESGLPLSHISRIISMTTA